MIIKTIKCDVAGCRNSFSESKENSGFPGWGHISGLFEKLDDGTIRETAYLCPVCLFKAMQILNGEITK